MNGTIPMISTALPFVLRLSKDERRVFQQNQVGRQADQRHDPTLGVNAGGAGDQAIMSHEK